MTISIFIKTYAPDLVWLRFCLRSIHKFCTGFRDVIVLVPQRDMSLVDKMNLTQENVIPVPDNYPDPYLGQQSYKVHADLFTDADYIYFTDSDVIFVKPFKPQDIMEGDRPIILMTPYTTLTSRDGQPATPWQPITEKALGHPVRFEFMRRNELMVPRQLLPLFREHIQRTHGRTTEQYIMEQPYHAFSEFNALFAYAYYHHPFLFKWHNTDTDGIPEPHIKQHWSYSGLTDIERQEIERILA